MFFHLRFLDLGAIRYSTPMCVGDLVMVAAAVILHFVGTVHQDVKTFVSATLYITTGILLYTLAFHIVEFE